MTAVVDARCGLGPNLITLPYYIRVRARSGLAPDHQKFIWGSRLSHLVRWYLQSMDNAYIGMYHVAPRWHYCDTLWRGGYYATPCSYHTLCRRIERGFDRPTGPLRIEERTESQSTLLPPCGTCPFFLPFCFSGDRARVAYEALERGWFVHLFIGVNHSLR